MFTPAPAFRTRPELRGTFGMAASTHWLATAVANADPARTMQTSLWSGR